MTMWLAAVGRAAVVVPDSSEIGATPLMQHFYYILAIFFMSRYANTYQCGVLVLNASHRLLGWVIGSPVGVTLWEGPRNFIRKVVEQKEIGH